MDAYLIVGLLNTELCSFLIDRFEKGEWETRFNGIVECKYFYWIDKGENRVQRERRVYWSVLSLCILLLERTPAAAYGHIPSIHSGRAIQCMNVVKLKKDKNSFPLLNSVLLTPTIFDQLG